MNKQTLAKSSSRPVLLGLAAGILLSSAAAQDVEYGIEKIGSTDWAYLRITGGEELISAPLVTPSSGAIDVGLGHAPTYDTVPVLSMEGKFSAGTTNKFSVTGAQPGSDVKLVFGFKIRAADFAGGTLLPNDDLTLPLATGADGSGTYSIVLPDDWDLDMDVWVQAIVPDSDAVQGLSLSNALHCNGSMVGTTFEDSTRMRLFGFELNSLPDPTEGSEADIDVDYFVEILQSREACTAAFLWKSGFPDFRGTSEELAVLSHLSQHLTTFKEKTTKFEGGGWNANGCTSVPDFNFKKCCDKHDECYCIGGNWVDRWKCDLKFKKCILFKNPALACVYYKGVRIFGGSHFNWD